MKLSVYDPASLGQPQRKQTAALRPPITKGATATSKRLASDRLDLSPEARAAIEARGKSGDTPAAQARALLGGAEQSSNFGALVSRLARGLATG